MQIYNEKILKRMEAYIFMSSLKNWEEVYAELKKLSEEDEHEY